MTGTLQESGNLSVGKCGEEIAVNYLKGCKFKILERNFRCRCGEVDIIAREGKTFVFIEVKTRRNDSYGPPQLSVTQFKQRQISKAALLYMSSKKIENEPARFDVIAICLSGQEKPLIDHIKNAFDLTY
ncbi:MAG TPA: YraN family protein [Geobacteraceae bacterium]|nr:YraN family protein [Geobacteraceae bacterium]